MFVEFIILYLRPVVNPIRVLINRIQLSVHLNNKHSNHLKTNFMNTLLLSTNTANCTTKNLKKIAAVICMTAVFVFTNTAIFAQGFSNSEGKTVSEQEAAKQKWVEENRDELNKTNTPTVVKPASVQPKSKVVATEKTVAVKNVTPVISTKQVVTAQSAETVDNAVEVTVVKPEIKVVENTKAETPVEVKVSENQPYLNYKGIRNPKEARKLWVAENPEAAEKLAEKLQQGEVNQKAEPVQKTIQK